MNEQLNYYFSLTSKLWQICWNDQYVSKHSAVLILCKTPLLCAIYFCVCHCNTEKECFKLTVLWVKIIILIEVSCIILLHFHSMQSLIKKKPAVDKSERTV